MILKLLVNIIPVISAVFVIVGIRLFKQKIENKVNYFSFLMFASAIYSFGYFLELNCVSLNTLLLVRNFEFLGSVFVPTFGILFITELTKIKKIKKSAGILFAVSTVLWLIFITNPLHHLIYKSVDLRIVRGFSVPSVVREPVFYSLMLYYAFFLIFASIVLLKAYKKSKRRRNKNNFRFLFVFLQIPWLTILFILLGFDTYVDPVPAIIIIICILFGINEIKNDRFEVQINSWNGIFADIGEPAFMVDSTGEIICSNINADSFFIELKKSTRDVIENLDKNESHNKAVFFTINNEIKWFNIKKYNFDTQRKLTSYLLINITDRKQAEETIIENEKRLLTAQMMVHMGNWELNLDTETIWASEEAFNIYGLEYASQYLPLELMQKNILPEYRKALDDALIGLITKKGKYDEKYKIKNIKTGKELFVHSRAVLLVDEGGNAVKVVGTIQDITEYKKVEEEILYMGFHDQLTGLYNRRFYEEELKRLDTERNLPMTIAMFDVNGLKLVNDSFGHSTGDELLKKAAEVIKQGCRSDDIIARLEGDEFVIILPETDALKTGQIIKRIKSLSLKEKVGVLDVSITFGYKTKNNKEEDIQEIFKNTKDYVSKHKLSESSGINSKIIDLIMNRLFEKNNREMLHSKQVGKICKDIATKMNFDKDNVSQIKIAGLMHDIGKIRIDKNILDKPQKLSSDEQKEIEKHSETGYRILSSVNEFSEIAEYILEHHEKWNGEGYPRGLRGEEISLQARIIAVADAFDAMTRDRTYGKALSEEEAINEIRRCSGTQFDPEIAGVFVKKVLGKE